ncbi:small GTPase RHO1 [Histoplasma capsulatum var. duboisii H88]|uniref:Small GTPase RHO1 n=1 Tax=Ajellomyces capsulatus (strain H88) TaxID=544711 RepID=A0A8A1LAQ2_AJEC8|nr:small GTPase RHO1 [Histoplasma capsulatum var. duboisii H88]
MASQTPEHSKPVRCAFVGSDGVGKTSILYRLFRSKAPPIEDFLNVSDDQAPRGRYGMPSLCDICDHQTLNMEYDGLLFLCQHPPLSLNPLNCSLLEAATKTKAHQAPFSYTYSGI